MLREQGWSEPRTAPKLCKLCCSAWFLSRNRALKGAQGQSFDVSATQCNFCFALSPAVLHFLLWVFAGGQGVGSRGAKDRKDHLQPFCCPPNLDTAFNPAMKHRFSSKIANRSKSEVEPTWNPFLAGAQANSACLRNSLCLLVYLAFCAAGIARTPERASSSPNQKWLGFQISAPESC